jgi:hypothetical protein
MSWRRVYISVIVFTLLTLTFLYYFSQYFSG